MTWTRSLHLPSLTDDLTHGLQVAMAHGFTHVDVAGVVDRSLADREALADSGLIVVAVDLRLTPDQALDCESVTRCRAGVEAARRQIADAAQLGATVCCLEAAPPDEVFALLTEYAAARMLCMCVLEHRVGADRLHDRQGRLAHLRINEGQEPLQVCGPEYRGCIAIRLRNPEPALLGVLPVQVPTGQ